MDPTTFDIEKAAMDIRPGMIYIPTRHLMFEESSHHQPLHCILCWEWTLYKLLNSGQMGVQ